MDVINRLAACWAVKGGGGMSNEEEEGELLIAQLEIRSGMGLCSFSGCLVGVLPNDFYHIILQRNM